MRRLWLLLFLLFLPARAHAQMCPGLGNVQLAPISGDSEVITVAGTAIGFTAANLTVNGIQAVAAVWTVETNPIRYFDDGSIPTGSVGQLVSASATASPQYYTCGRQSLQKFRAIRTGGSASLTVTYYAFAGANQ